MEQDSVEKIRKDLNETLLDNAIDAAMREAQAHVMAREHIQILLSLDPIVAAPDIESFNHEVAGFWETMAKVPEILTYLKLAFPDLVPIVVEI